MFGLFRRERQDGRKFDWTVVVACFFVAVGAVFVLNGVFAGVTGDDRSPLPDPVESVSPVPEASQTLAHESVRVDLKPQYYGTLTIDGVLLETVNFDDVVSAVPEAGSQVELPSVVIYEPGNATLTFTPAAGAAIEQFSTGRHVVKLTYWSLIEGPETARTFSWTFDVV